jgi:hypothetical protein
MTHGRRHARRPARPLTGGKPARPQALRQSRVGAPRRGFNVPWWRPISPRRPSTMRHSKAADSGARGRAAGQHHGEALGRVDGDSAGPAPRRGARLLPAPCPARRCLPGAVEATDCPGHGRRSPRSRASRQPAPRRGCRPAPQRRGLQRAMVAADLAKASIYKGVVQRPLTAALAGEPPATTTARMPASTNVKDQSGGSATAAAAAFEKCCRRRGHGLSAVYDPERPFVRYTVETIRNCNFPPRALLEAKSRLIWSPTRLSRAASAAPQCRAPARFAG